MQLSEIRRHSQPLANLTSNTLFTATVTTAVTDLAGNTLASNYVWTFTTGSVPDTTSPELVSTIPMNAATDVPINQAISATFSEAMDPLTILPQPSNSRAQAGL